MFTQFLCGTSIVILLALSGYIYLIDRSNKAHEQSVLQSRLKRMPRSKRIIIGCSIVIIMLVCGVVCFFAYTLRISKVLSTEVNYPNNVRVGDSFKLTLYLTNNSDEDIKIETIQLKPSSSENYESILAGVTVTGTKPAMNSIEWPSINAVVYEYSPVVMSGETNTVVFDLKAVKPGEFHTDIDVVLSDSISPNWDSVIYITP